MNLERFLEHVVLIGFIVTFSLGNVASGMNWPSVTLLVPLFFVVICLLLRDCNIGGLRNITLLHLYVTVFGVFCLLSVLWATNVDLALDRSIAIFRRFSVLFFLYWYFYNKNTVRDLLQIIMFSNYVIVFIVIWFYGWETVVILLNFNIRVDNDLLNANTLGMGAAYSSIIGLYYAYYEKKIWNIFIIIPTVAMVALSGSKKAGIILGVGIFFLIFLKKLSRGISKVAFYKVIISVFATCAILFMMFNLPFFENLTDRFALMMNLFSNEYAGSSTEDRYAMMLLGLDIFEKHPLLGVGIDNALIYNAPNYYYLHSNPFEILADIGLIGFCIYYWIYLLIAYRFFKYRDFSSNEYIISLTLLCIFLLMNVASVTYSDMTTYLYLALFYHESVLLNRNKKGKCFSFGAV